MKYARFYYKNEVHYGIVENESVNLVKGDIYFDWDYTGEIVDLNQIELLSPVTPRNIIGVGANYTGKEEEIPEFQSSQIPIFFLKPTSSIIGPNQEIVIPESIEQVKFESELVLVIGKETKNISEEEVFDHIFGYTIGNDVTAPQYFHKNGHWTLGKAFDTFMPVGPVIQTNLDPSKVYVKATVNQHEYQNSSTKLMIITLKEMVSYLSKIMTLQVGDIILTGSPLGAAFVKNGDIVECKIDEIGVLKNKVTKNLNI